MAASKKKKQAGAKVAVGENRAQPRPTTAPGNLWPDSFATPKRTAQILIILAAVTFILLGLAMTHNLLWVKRLLGYAIGVPTETLQMLDAFGWDIFLVAITLLWMIGAALIHPSVGLGLLIIIRPWLDGYTYPMDNLYFIWAILAITALWNLRFLMEGGRYRGHLPILVLLGFLLTALAVAPASYQLDNTYIRLIVWFALACLFWTVVNTTRSRAATGVLVAAFLISLGIEALYSILNYYYLLPFLRNALVHSAELRMQYFGVNEFTPELARRFNINRAFGSMLFPNALAAYMILGIPGSAAVTAYLLRQYRKVRGQGAEAAPSRFKRHTRGWALGFGLGGWLLTLLLLFVVQQFPIMYALGQLPFYLQGAMPFLNALVLGAIPGFLLFRYTLQRGAFPALLLTACCLAGLSLLLQSWTLIITYSRGGLLALFGAAVITGVLFFIKHNKALGTAALRSAATILLLLGMAASVGGMLYHTLAPESATAQSPARDALTRMDTRNVVTDRGTDISLQELADPASMRLRFTYWQVGMRMFQDNPISGVGLGNFGLAYPIYQHPTDGDVREAHNSYLQIFSESGLVGGLFFVGFWGVVLWGLLRGLWRERDPLHHLLLAGGFCGLLAFLAHALIDINFSHVGLSMLSIAWAGLWYAFARRHEDIEAGSTVAAKTASQSASSGAYRYIAIPVLLLTALVFGLSLRPYLQELAIARMSFISVSDKANNAYNRKFQILSHYTNEVARYAHTGEGQRPYIMVSDAMFLGIPLEDIVSRDTVFQRIPETGGIRRLPEGTPIPPDAVVRIERLWPAFYDAVEAFERYLEFLERQHRRFPYNADLVYNIAQGYEHLIPHVDLPMRPELKERYLERLEFWATEARRLSPRNKDMHIMYAKMLWHRGMHAADGPNIEDLRLSIRSQREAATLAPNVHSYVERYARALHRMAAQMEELGLEEEAQRYAEEGERMYERFRRITQLRIAVGLM